MLAAWLASIDYAATPTGHPTSLAISEDRILAALDRWLVGLFAPDRVAEVARAVIDADQQANAEHPDVAQARHTMATDRRKIERHLAALEARPRPDPHRGAHKQAQADVAAARQVIHNAPDMPDPLTEASARAALTALRELPTSLDDADTDLRAGLYRSLGIMLSYRRESGAEYIKVQAELRGVDLAACRRSESNHKHTRDSRARAAVPGQLIQPVRAPPARSPRRIGPPAPSRAGRELRWPAGADRGIMVS